MKSANKSAENSGGTADHQRSLYRVLWATLLVTIVSLALSVTCLVRMNQAIHLLAQQPVDPDQLFKKLLKHPEAKPYFGVKPLAFIRIDQHNLPTLANQIQGLDSLWVGNYLVQYTNAIFLFNYAQDRILERFTLNEQTNATPGQPQLSPSGTSGTSGLQPSGGATGMPVTAQSTPVSTNVSEPGAVPPAARPK